MVDPTGFERVHVSVLNVTDDGVVTITKEELHNALSQAAEAAGRLTQQAVVEWLEARIAHHMELSKTGGYAAFADENLYAARGLIKARDDMLSEADNG